MVLVDGVLDPIHDMVSQHPSLVRHMKPGMVVRRSHLHQGIHHLHALLLHLISLHDGTCSTAMASFVTARVPPRPLVSGTVVLVELKDIMGN